jgi:hypothetical protein
MSVAAHTVQLYADEAVLADVVARFVAEGLGAGEACIVVATAAHDAAVAARLGAAGHDVLRAVATGRLVFLDARDTIERFLVDGQPGTERFGAVVGDRVRALSRGGVRVRVYGELVDLLWSDGRPDAALAVEVLWSALLAEEPLSLLCGYSVARLPRRDDEVARLQQRALSLELEVAERRSVEAELRETQRQRDVLEHLVVELLGSAPRRS